MTVEVKRALGPSAVITSTPRRAQAMIRAAAEVAMATGRKPYRATTPVVIELEYHRTDMRARGLELGGEPIGTRSIRFLEDDVPATVARVWAALAHTLREEASFLK